MGALGAITVDKTKKHPGLKILSFKASGAVRPSHPIAALLFLMIGGEQAPGAQAAAFLFGQTLEAGLGESLPLPHDNLSCASVSQASSIALRSVKNSAL